jgi:hypothetical protein
MTAAEKAERAARRARLDAISEGLAAEVAAFNAAIRGGKDVRLPRREDGSLNDGRWEALLMQAGVARDPRTV